MPTPETTRETTPETTPVIIGVGEFVDRPADPATALEPVDLMAHALRVAEADAGAEVLGRLQSLELIGLISWRYRDPVALLCARLGIAPARTVNASMGGETPIRLIHEAAVRIAQGELEVAGIVGGESSSSAGRARKAGTEPPWTPQPSPAETVRFPSSRFAMSEAAKALGVMDPAQVYPLYEVATQATWGQTPEEGERESAALWARYAQVAAQNPSAWIRSAPDAEAIARPGPDNRPINWPYPKLMVANPSVNQGAAVIVSSLAFARSAGVPEERIVHIWGGAAAREPEDYLERDAYDHSTAQEAALKAAVTVAGGDARAFRHMELYSCFPVVPKMALKTLGLGDEAPPPTVAGGLTFFGGPLNNYMSHAVAAMVRGLRAHPGELGLLYGQGGYVNKHHTLVVSTTPPPQPLALDYAVQGEADAARGPSPAIAPLDHEGPATLETYTVRFDRNGDPLDGIVVVRTPDGARALARVPAEDDGTLGPLLSREKSAVGAAGRLRVDSFGKPAWRADSAGAPARKFCKVQREGPLTVVTIDRPEAMNALHPAANAELAEVFDDFANDPEQWVAILTGAGDRAFSAGNDLKWTAMARGRGATQETPLTGFAGLTSRFDLDKPVIAAVNGVAMGGGFEIALACDIIVASEAAVFALPEPRVGLAALAGGLLRLPRQIGQKAAMGMILTGRRVSAAEAQALGFVNEVAAPDKLMDAARAWAAQILECSPMSIRASKQAARMGLDAPSVEAAYREQMRWPALQALMRSEDAREGPMAFAQKRKPQWRGR